MNKVLEILTKKIFNGGVIREFAVAIGLIFVIAMLIIPMPIFFLDLLMSVNLLLSIVIILNVLFIRSSLEFSVFPSMLLISTIFSLALNISSTRLILTQGENFTGKIVRAFGRFVVGTSGPEGIVVGIVIFTILIAVQFIVITKGSSRVSEVSARFALDALPGKQMAIEAEFNSGAITEEELVHRRRELQREVDFYGSMDGASKFVSGNVKAGILITIINMIGGLIIGTVIRQESLSSAVTNYIQLTIGDGLVSQLPSLLISTAAGIIVTRSISQGNISEDITKEFSNYSRIYYIAGGLISILAFLPGFPWYVLLPLGGFLIMGALFLEKKKAKGEKLKQAEQEVQSKEHSVQVHTQRLEPLDPISLEIGYDLVPLVQDKNGQAELLNRISSIRREIGIKIGVVIPLVRILDNYALESSQYSIKFSGVEIGRGNIRTHKLLAITSDRVLEEQKDRLLGEKTKEPAFGLPAIWINREDKALAERIGYTVADPTAVISTHISTILENNAAQLLTRQDTSGLLEQFSEKHPTVVEDVKKHLSMMHIQRVLRGLLEEKISVRNLIAILETLSEYGEVTKDIGFLIEKTRQALAPQISSQYADENRVIYGYAFDYEVEKSILDAQNTDGQMLPIEFKQKIIHSISETMKPLKIERKTDSITNATEHYDMNIPILIVSEGVRLIIKDLLSSNLNKIAYTIPIFSTLEIADGFTLKIVGHISIEESNNVIENREEAVVE